MAEIAKDTFAPCSCLVRHLPYFIFCKLLVGYGAHGKRALMFLVLPRGQGSAFPVGSGFNDTRFVGLGCT